MGMYLMGAYLIGVYLTGPASHGACASWVCTSWERTSLDLHLHLSYACLSHRRVSTTGYLIDLSLIGVHLP
jgi:hypothetical protein